MDRLNVDSPFASVCSCVQNSADATVIPPDDFSPMPSITGHHVRTLDPPLNGFLVNRLFDQDILPSPRSLNDFPISHFPSFENEIMRPDLYSPKPPDEIFSCDFSCTDPTLTNAEQTAHQLSPENPLVSLSQRSSRPVTKPDPLHKDTQEQVITETIETPESCGSEEPLPQTPAVAHKQSRKRKAHGQSRKRKASNQDWAKSERGKAYMKAYRKAYNSVLYKTDGDREKARIAGKEAATIILESYIK